MIIPGLALFYGGLVRSKNVLGTIMHSFVILCVVSLLWVLGGYSLAFGPDVKGLIGGLDWVGLRGVGLTPHATYGPTIPHQAFMIFQLMFAAITPALITGAFAERMKFSALLIFSALWSLVIYCPIAHWLWGGGWLAGLGALDFAGGAVKDTERITWRPTICRWCCWRQASFGSGGSGLTREAHWVPTRRLSWRLSPPILLRSRRPSAGWRSNGGIAARQPYSALPVV